MNPLHDSADYSDSDGMASTIDSKAIHMEMEQGSTETTPRSSSIFRITRFTSGALRQLSNFSARSLSNIVLTTDSSRTHSEQPASGSSLFGAGFNFVNSIVGAGIIGMPIAIKESGFFMGIILLVSIAWLINKSTIMLIDCGMKAKKIDLEELCEHVLGKTGFYLSTLFMFLYAYGAMIAYMVIIGDTVPVALDYFIGEDSPSKTVIMILAAVFVILPLCLMRDMSTLASTSALSISADFLMIIFICVRGPISARNQETEFESSDINFAAYRIFEGIGTFSFAFVCQHSSFIVYRSMKEPTLDNWTKVANGALMVAASMCLTLGLAGYLSFGSYTEGDILNNFSDEDEVMLGARLLLAITMVFTFPMECFVARHAIFSAYHKYRYYQSKDNLVNDYEYDKYDETQLGGVRIPHPDPNHEPPQMFPHALVTLSLWGSAVTIAIVFSDLRIVLALTGALAASMLGYILPSLIYIRTFAVEWEAMKSVFSPSSHQYKPLLFDRLKSTEQFILPVSLCLFGVMAMVIGVATVMYDIASE